MGDPDIFTFFVVGCVFTFACICFQLQFVHYSSEFRHWLQNSDSYAARCTFIVFSRFLPLLPGSYTITPLVASHSNNAVREMINSIEAVAEQHDSAKAMSILIREDGAGSWPPSANHNHNTWPSPLRPYREIYLELATLLPQQTPSLDDGVNVERIAEFRYKFRTSLQKRVNVAEVQAVSTSTTLKHRMRDSNL